MNKFDSKIELRRKENGLIYLIDVDDFIVRSSDKLQAILDEKTNFKTDVLRMLEQLNRNCSYLVDQVTIECNRAQLAGRIPSLEKFPLFEKVDLKRLENKDLYEKPVMVAKYYQTVAKMFYEQYLEERDTFLEIDNLPRGNIYHFNYQREMEVIERFADLYFKNIEMFHKINVYCYEEIKRIINEAKNNNDGSYLTIPEYGNLVKMDNNDILKKNSLDDSGDFRERILYDKPLQNVYNCLCLDKHLYDVITNAKVYITPSREIVDYSLIHSIENVDTDVLKLNKKIIYSGLIRASYFSTHHNGNREEEAKKALLKEILPEVDGFIGQRFHSTIHDAERRERSSKIEHASNYLGVSPKVLLLGDDSKANCHDCQLRGASEIFFKPRTDSEIIKGAMEDTGFNRITGCKQEDEYLVFSYIAKAYEKLEQEKLKIKKV